MNKKTKQKSNDNPANLPRALRVGMFEADQLLERGKPQEALEILKELAQKFPNQPDVLSSLTNAYHDLNDIRGYLHGIYKLHGLSPNKAEIKIGLAGGYLSNGYMALALQTFRQFVQRWPEHERAVNAQKTMAELEQALATVLSEHGFSMENDFDFACKQDELRLNLDMGNYDRCRKLAQPLLAQHPNYPPILNNLAQIEWLEGNLEQAILLSRQVVETEPENIHALSNLARFSFILGNTEEARQYALHLKQSQADATDPWIKKAEAFSLIGDDEAMVELVEQAKKTRDVSELNGMFWHWAACAYYRLGDVARAREYWQKSTQTPPRPELAQTNLSELKKPAHERICPQVFGIDEWIPRKVVISMAAMGERAARQKNDNTFQQKLNLFITDYPVLIQFASQALHSGDQNSRDFILKLADISMHPKILDSLDEFVRSQHGPDEMRLQASQTLTKNGRYKSGESINFWRNGEWTSIMMFGVSISSKAKDWSSFKPSVRMLMEQAIHALQDSEGAKAEAILRKALAIQGDEPGLLNNLASALSMQDKEDEANAIADRILARFPVYFFGQVIGVRRALLHKQLPEARQFLDKMSQKTELHFSEFSVLCACQIDYAIAADEPKQASIWLNIWKRGAPDDPDIEWYQNRLNPAEKKKPLLRWPGRSG